MIKIYGSLFKAKIKMLSIYKGDFIIGLISSLVKAAIGILFLNFIFMNFSAIGGMDNNISYCLYFSISLVQSLINLFFLGLVDFSSIYIRGGELETVLLKPVNKIAYIIVDNIDIREAPSLIVNLILYIISINMMHKISLWNGVIIVVGPLVSLCVMISMILLIDCFSFRFRDTLMTIKFVVSLSDICRYPMSIYRKEIQYLFSIIIPIGAEQLICLGDIKKIPFYFGWVTFIAFVTMILSIYIFSLSFKWYESAGS